MPFAHQDVLEVRQRWVVCCYKRQNFLSHVFGLFWSRLAFSELTLAPNRSRVSGRVKSNAVVSPTVSIEQVTVPPSQVLCQEGTQLLNLITLCLAEWKGQVCADKWAALMQLRWVLEASEHYKWNQGIYGSADRNLEQIRRLFGNLLSFAWRWSVGLVTCVFTLFIVDDTCDSKKRRNAV